MPPIRVKAHEWTTFELQTMLSLMARGIHLTPTGKDPSGTERSTTYLNFATEFNKALHGENFREDIEKKDIIRCLERLMVTKKYIVRSGGLMDRQRPGRITRGLRMAWEGNRRLDFDGTREEWEGGRKEKELEKAKQRAAMAAKLRAINYERQGMGLPLLTRLPKEDEPESEPEDASQPQNKPVEKKKTPEPVTTDRAEDNSYLSRAQSSFLTQVQSLGSFSPPKPIETYHTSPPPRKQKRPGTGRERLTTKITGNLYKNALRSSNTNNHNNWDGAAMQGIAQSGGEGEENEAYGTYQQVGAVTMENDMSMGYGAGGYEESAYAGTVENSYAAPAPASAGYVENAYSGQHSNYGGNGNYTPASAYHNNSFYGAPNNDFRSSAPAYGSGDGVDGNGMVFASSPDTSGPETPAAFEGGGEGLGKGVGGGDVEMGVV